MINLYKFYQIYIGNIFGLSWVYIGKKLSDRRMEAYAVFPNVHS